MVEGLHACLPRPRANPRREFLLSVAAPAAESSSSWTLPFVLSVAALAAESSDRWEPPFVLSVSALAAESSDLAHYEPAH